MIFNSVSEILTHFIVFTSHCLTFDFRCALYRLARAGQMYIVKRETVEAEWRLALDFACSFFAAAAVLRSNRDKTHFLPLPLCHQCAAALPCSTVGSLLCSAGNLSLTPHHAFLPLLLSLHQTSHHLTYRNIHTSCTKDVKRHQKMISHQRRWCPSPAPETLVLVVTLYEVDSRHCDMPLPSIFNTNSFLHQVTFPGRSSPTNQH